MKLYEIAVKGAKITSKFGYRIHPIYKDKRKHNGIDIVSTKKDYNLCAIDDGYVQKVVTGQDKSKTGYGNYIWIRYPKYNLSLIYAHCKKINLKKGAKVVKNQVVAIMGTTGASTGIHLHLGMTKIGSDKWLNPADYSEILNNTYTGTFPKLPLRGYFKKGDKGSQVKNLQKLLNWANNAKLTIDGVLGDKTISQVKAFQNKVKINVDGKFGRNTLKKAKEFEK